MPSIINLSFPSYQDYDTIRTTASSCSYCSTSTTRSNVSCYPSIQSNISSFNNHYYYHYRNSNLSSSRTSPSTTIDSDNYEEEEEETEATCGECGKLLGPGWQCESCRRSCPYCNRALTTDPNDYCERCYLYCDKHDIIYPIINSETQEGPKCPECRKAQEEEKE